MGTPDPWEDILSRVYTLEHPSAASGVGQPVVRAFPFAFDTAGLADGVGIYTPSIGEILLDAWIEVGDTGFNGTTPKADISQFLGGTTGWWGSHSGAIDLTDPDFSRLDSVLSADGAWQINADGSETTNGAVSLSNMQISAGSDGTNLVNVNVRRLVPAKFVTADPVLLVVSQDGSKGGLATGATFGTGVVYLVTAVPATPTNPT